MNKASVAVFAGAVIVIFGSVFGSYAVGKHAGEYPAKVKAAKLLGVIQEMKCRTLGAPPAGNPLEGAVSEGFECPSGFIVLIP
jgi:hypothetical protein